MKKVFLEVELEFYEVGEDLLMVSAFLKGGRYDTETPDDWDVFN